MIQFLAANKLESPVYFRNRKKPISNEWFWENNMKLSRRAKDVNFLQTPAQINKSSTFARHQVSGEFCRTVDINSLVTLHSLPYRQLCFFIVAGICRGETSSSFELPGEKIRNPSTAPISLKRRIDPVRSYCIISNCGFTLIVSDKLHNRTP